MPKKICSKEEPMKTKVATPKTRVNKLAVALAEYKVLVHAYVNKILARKSVEHSRTASVITREGKTGPSSILVSELTSIVRTASKLDKLVVLGVYGEELVVLLEDKVPTPTYGLNF
jgi:hypothetical protein